MNNDLISREALKKAFEAWKNMDDYYHDTDCDDIPLSEAYDLIDNIPTVTPDMAQVLAYESGKASADRPVGKWIKCDFHNYGERVYWNYKCTNCEAVYSTQYNYCPDCGAEMKQEEENE